MDDPTSRTADRVPEDLGSGPSDAAPARPVPSARWDVFSHLRLWPVAVVGLVLDLWTKHEAFTRLDPDPSRSLEVIPHLMSFQRSLNPGALFGMGKGLTPLFIGASILAVGFVVFLFIHSTRDRRTLHLALGLILGGALGNMYDRVFYVADVVTYSADNARMVLVRKVIEEHEDGGLTVGSWPEGASPHRIPGEWNPRQHQQGVVRDFIRMEPRINIGSRSIPIYPWVFNLADAWLVIGVGLLLLNFWWDRQAEKAAQGGSPGSGQPTG